MASKGLISTWSIIIVDAEMLYCIMAIIDYIGLLGPLFVWAVLLSDK